nr:ribosomal RNA small subunit methyltransferase, mitochondrial [Ipomoea batatas]GMC82147.1 ribosomal RNA small subunit methyltransferase, mitochondrial [Ipomoea batatas]
MLHRQYLLQYNIFRHLLPRHFLQRQLRSKSSRRFNGGRSNHEEDDGNVRRKIENQEANIYLLKSRGQHLLTNPRVLDSIVGKSNVLPTDTVLEIGPGTGNLTLKLLNVAERVLAIEIDKRMVEILNKRAAEHGLGDKLSIVCQDALKTEFPRFDLMVANIPYGISSPLVAKLVFGANAYRSATLLLQKEFARRLLANPGDSEFNRLAVNVKLVADVEFVMDVSKRDFLPCPKVDSSVVKIHPKASIPDVNLDEWWAFTRTCFTKKNKTLGATFKQKRLLMELMKLQEMKEDQESVEDCSLQSGLEIIELASFREMIINILSSGGFDDKRPSKLSHEELLHLLSLFNQSGVSFHGPAKPKNPRQTTFAAACDPT